MWWQTLDDVAANLFAWFISEKGGDVIGVAVLLVIGIVTVIRWHRRQRAAKKLGMASLYFIIPCLAVGIIAVAAAAFGFGLREMKAHPTTEGGTGQTEIDLYSGKPVATANPYPQSILTSRYYSRKNKEDVADIIDKANDVINKQGKDIFSLSEIAINRSPWDSPTADLPPMIDRMEHIEALAADFQRDLFEVLYRDYPDYKTELDNLFPPRFTVGSFETSAREFENAITVWGELRDTVDGGRRSQLSQLVGTARFAFGRQREEFSKWVSELQIRIDQTRKALRQ
jgi:hypothetical protein